MMRTMIVWLADSKPRAFLLLFLLGFALRVGTLSLLPPSLIPPNPKWETGAVASSLVQRGEFADPYLIPTGPTAHMPPLQVGLFALLYKAVGFSYLGGLIRWLMVMAAHATIFALLPWLAGWMGMRTEVGVIGGLAGSVIPHWPYELESFSAVALALVLWLFLRRWRAGRFPEESRASNLGSLLLGIVLGVSFHLQPALLPVVLGCLGFELWWRTDARKWRQVGMLTLTMVLACIPWGWRNYEELGAVCFVRCNLGLELYVGNHDGAHADIDVSEARGTFRHPRTSMEEAEKVLAVGEANYMREKKDEALDWMASNPGEFLKLTAMRVLFFWGGPLYRFPSGSGQILLLLFAVIGAWRIIPVIGVPQRAALLIPLSTYPLVYYVVGYLPRYGYPVRWILFLLAGCAVWEWIGTKKTTGPLEGASASAVGMVEPSL